MFSRTVREVVPPHVEYAITPIGETLGPILDAMAAWGLANPQLQRRPGGAEVA